MASTLAEELVEEILLRVPPDEPAHLVSASVVCKAWHTIVSDGSFLRRYRRFHRTPPLLGCIWNHKKLVQEILLRIPPDEPVHLARATLVCKSWHSILSDNSFLCRYRRFHGTPPLLGYIYNHYDNDLTGRFVPTTFVATPAVHTWVLDYSGRTTRALDCHHGRVLSEAKDCRGLVGSLIVWDPITGGQQNLSMPSYLQYVRNLVHVGAVLCAKNGCDHLYCHNGPFLVVIVGTSYVGGNDVVGTWASMYSSETGAWSARTPIITHQYVDDWRPSLLIGDALYFTTVQRVIIKSDLRKHGLSEIGNLPGQFRPMLMKGDDGGLGVAAMLHSRIHMWSWRAGINGIDEWVKYRVMELDTQIPKGGRPGGLICMVEGTNTIFIGIDTRIFMINLKSGQVRRIGERDTYIDWRILLYMSFYTPKC